MKPFVVSFLACCLFLSTAAADPALTVTVDAGRPGARINPAMWGIFFEDINFGADGGLYAELVKNRGFEFGDATNGRPVALRVFDDRDAQFRFIFTAAGGASGKFTQDNINLAVQSLQAIPILER